MRLLSVISIVSISFCLITAATAGIYKWVDDNGQVHYGERPAGQQAEKLHIKTRHAARPALDSDAKADDKQTDKAAPKAPPAALPDEVVEVKLSRREKHKRCKAAKSRLQNIQSRARLKETDAKGNVRALTPKERAQRIKQARSSIREYCR